MRRREGGRKKGRQGEREGEREGGKEKRRERGGKRERERERERVLEHLPHSVRSMVGDMKLWEHSSVVKLLTTLASGYTAGVRIQLGHIQDFVNTSSVCKLHFIKASEAGELSMCSRRT